MNFKFFNPNEPLDISQKRLPHWEQGGATYFITFRTADSIPREVLARWHQERSLWRRERGIDTSKGDWQQRFEQLPEPERKVFHRTFTKQWQDQLDDCQGDCVLMRNEMAQVVADALLHFEGVRYHLSDFIIMPNHVHVLAGIKEGEDLMAICRSWKKYSAREINKKLGTQGEFWQPESFDHLVRGEFSFLKYRRYIADNPTKAKLSAGAYLLWHRSPVPPPSSPVTP